MHQTNRIEIWWNSPKTFPLRRVYMLGPSICSWCSNNQIIVLVYAQEFSRNAQLSCLTRHQLPRTTKNPLGKLEKLLLKDTSDLRVAASLAGLKRMAISILKSWPRKLQNEKDLHDLHFAIRLYNATHGLRFLDT